MYLLVIDTATLYLTYYYPSLNEATNHVLRYLGESKDSLISNITIVDMKGNVVKSY